MRQVSFGNRPRSTMDSIRVSEAPDPSSILGEATKYRFPTFGGQACLPAGIPVEATKMQVPHHWQVGLNLSFGGKL